jgi:ATP-binding cassette subfamily B multidrug efflux pump
VRELLRWIWGYRSWYAAGLAALLLVDAVQTATPFLVRRLIDDLAVGDDTRVGLLCAAMLAIAAAMVGLRFLWRWWIVGAARRIRRDMREALHRSLLRLDAAGRSGRSTGDLMALSGNDLDAVAMACGFGCLALFDAVFMIAFAFGAMLHLDSRLALLAAAPLPLIAAVQWLAGRAIHRRFERVQARFGELTEGVREALTGIRTLKAHAREAGAERGLDAANEANLHANLALARINALFDPAIALLGGAALAIVLAAGGRMVIAGELSLGSLVAFTAFLAMLAWPMMAIGWAVNLLSRGSASMTRIAPMLASVPRIADPAEPLPAPATADLELAGVTWTPPGATAPVLSGIEARLAHGGVLGVVGATGSGKSVLADLLVRLADPDAGTIRLGGTDIRALRLADLRRLVALVPQEPTVFAMTLRENLAFARPTASEEDIRTALADAALDDDVARMPRGLDTLLGERGVDLSGGQRQRLAIARALLARPALLVLDDCLSALDAATEVRVLASLRRRRSGVTTVVASHRLRTVADADLILVLERGRVAERGRHRELVTSGGIYARLHALQEAERAIEERA